jgi:hypothetical protein
MVNTSKNLCQWTTKKIPLRIKKIISSKTIGQVYKVHFLGVGKWTRFFCSLRAKTLKHCEVSSSSHPRWRCEPKCQF